MPSIREIFGGADPPPGLDPADGSADFDFDNLDDAFNQAIKNRPPLAGAAVDPDVPPAGLSTDGGDGAGGGDGLPLGAQTPPAPPSPVSGEPEGSEPAGPESPPAAPPPGPATVADPLGGLDPAARQELLLLHQSLTDPTRREQVLRAALGVSEPPPAAPAPPALPEDIDPGSVEALLWKQNQDTQAQLAEMREESKRRDAAFQQQAAVSAAERAGANFTARYGHVLSREDIGSIATRAGQRGLPFAIAQTNGGNLQAAMFEAMELTLRGDDEMLGRALGAVAARPAPAAPAGATDRKRKLAALSSAAQPSGAAPQRPPLTTRGDGKLDEKSRLTLVQEAANALRAGKE